MIFKKIIAAIAVFVFVILLCAKRPAFAMLQPSAKEFDNFARIVFEFESPVEYNAEIKDDYLELRFSSPVSYDLSYFLENLKGYIKSVDVSQNYKVIYIGLKKNYVLRSFDNNNAIYIDLLGEPFKQIEKNSRYLNVNTEIYEGFCRFTISDDEPIFYKLEKQKEQTKIIIKTNKDIDFQSLIAKLPEDLKKTKIISGENEITISIPSIFLSSFKLNKKAVIDVIYPITPKVSHSQNIVKDKNSIIKNALDKEKELANKNEKQKISQYLSKEENQQSRIVSLNFPWRRSTAMSVFKRAGYVWLVFDRKEDIDLNKIKQMGSDVILDIVNIPYKRATVLRILTLHNFYPYVRKEGLLWIVDLINKDSMPQNKIKVETKYKNKGELELFIPVQDASKMLPIVDPAVGDEMLVIPTFSQGYGIFPNREYMEFEMPETAQGIVFTPKSDDININLFNNGVEVTSNLEGGVTLSGNSFLGHITNIKKEDVFKAFDFSRWNSFRGAKSKLDRFDLNLRLSISSEEEIPKLRMELARYYIVNDMPAEAMGVIRLLERNSDYNNTGAFFALKGLTNFLMQRYKEAAEAFFDKSLNNEIEAQLFKNLSLAAADEKNSAKFASNILETLYSADDYPDFLKNKINLIALKSAFYEGKEMLVNKTCEYLSKAELSNAEKANFLYYLALIEQNKLNFYNSQKDLKDAIALDDRKYSTLAAKELVLQQLQTGLLDFKKAAQILQTLRMSWRGDEFEINLVEILADLYEQDGNYSALLRLLKDAVIVFQKEAQSQAFAAKMNQNFIDYYLNPNVGEHSPVEALAIYKEFNDLVPDNELGIKITKQLADRLISVDLLNDASMLLLSLLENKNTPLKEKPILGARLALVYLINNKPAEAIITLKNTDNEFMNSELKKQRLYLMVRALADIGKFRGALALIEDDKSEEALLLKLDIYWSNKLWRSAADTLHLLVKKPVKGKPIDKKQALLILDWITALKLDGREQIVTLIEKNFKPFFTGNEFEEIFNLLTNNSDPKNLNEITEQIDQAKKFQRFLGGHLEKIKASGLSSVYDDKKQSENINNNNQNTENPQATPLEESKTTPIEQE